MLHAIISAIGIATLVLVGLALLVDYWLKNRH